MDPIKFSRHAPTEEIAAAILALAPVGITTTLATAYVQLINQEMQRTRMLQPNIKGHEVYELVRLNFPASLQIVLWSALKGNVDAATVNNYYISVD